jgi:hypothetical protein
MGPAPETRRKESDVTRTSPITSRITNRTLMLIALVATVVLMLAAIAAGTNGSSGSAGHSKIELAAKKTVSGNPSRRA